MLYIIAIWYLIINVVSFVMYGSDKKKAVKGEWRIPESTLLTTGAMGGGIGSLIGMNFFRHKTKKAAFRIMVPLFIVVHGLIICFLYFVIYKNI